MSDDYQVLIAAFVLGIAVFLTFVVLAVYREPVEERLTDIAGKRPGANRLRSALSMLPGLGTLLMPTEESIRNRIETTLLQAGFYRHNAAAFYFGTKLLLMAFPAIGGLMLWTMGLLSPALGLIVVALTALLGALVPGVVIGSLKAARRTTMRRSLPDTLDMVVICLEGGLSLPASFGRVTDELATAYPMLAKELAIVRRELELGQPMGEVFQALADRFDVDELRGLAVLIGQSDRLGGSLVRMFRIQADGLRLKRYQYAEEQAQKAPLKIIFPTVLCIFPALYIVLMGPAAVQILAALENLSR